MKSTIQLTTLAAAGGKEHLEVMLAVLASFKFIKDVIRERSEALGTPGKRIT